MQVCKYARGIDLTRFCWEVRVLHILALRDIFYNRLFSWVFQVKYSINSIVITFRLICNACGGYVYVCFGAFFFNLMTCTSNFVFWQKFSDFTFGNYRTLTSTSCSTSFSSSFSTSSSTSFSTSFSTSSSTSSSFSIST